LRGGYWYYYAYLAGCAYRYYDVPSLVDYYVSGFRCVTGL
jgi:hypothetical protein